jgi:hypothetical protein
MINDKHKRQMAGGKWWMGERERQMLDGGRANGGLRTVKGEKLKINGREGKAGSRKRAAI